MCSTCLEKIIDSIQDPGINQFYILGGDGTRRGAYVIFEEIRRRGLKVSVVGIPESVDNDIPVIDKSFGFDTAVEEAQRCPVASLILDMAAIESTAAIGSYWRLFSWIN